MYRGSDQFLGLFPFKLEPLHRTLNRRTAGTRSSADELVRFDQTPKYLSPSAQTKIAFSSRIPVHHCQDFSKTVNTSYNVPFKHKFMEHINLEL